LWGGGGVGGGRGGDVFGGGVGGGLILGAEQVVRS